MSCTVHGPWAFQHGTPTVEAFNFLKKHTDGISSRLLVVLIGLHPNIGLPLRDLTSQIMYLFFGFYGKLPHFYFYRKTVTLNHPPSNDGLVASHVSRKQNHYSNRRTNYSSRPFFKKIVPSTDRNFNDSTVDSVCECVCLCHIIHIRKPR